MVKLRAFRATDDPEACQKFIEGHTRVLASVGVTKVTSNKAEWMDMDSVFVLVVEDIDSKEVLGGARIHAFDNKDVLPVEEAVSFMDEKVKPFIREYSGEGCGEICGFWNSRKVAGMGFGSLFLGRAAVTIATQIGLKSLFILCAPYVVGMSERFGFETVKSIGNDGTFYYPKLDLLATFMLLPNTTTLEKAKKSEKQKITALRKNPGLVVSEKTKVSSVEIQYDLNLKMTSIEEFHYPQHT